jgi:hypothetical protein
VLASWPSRCSGSGTRRPPASSHDRPADAEPAHLRALQRKAAIARFTRTLGTLVSSGVAILDGLEITAKTSGNRVLHDAIMESRTSIAGGETISEPLKKSGVFPPMVTSMINVGEQTGGLDEMLTKIADFYDEEVDAAVSALLAAMEPIMIVFLGVIVGGMIVAMYLPIFDMINAVGERLGLCTRYQIMTRRASRSRCFRVIRRTPRYHFGPGSFLCPGVHVRAPNGRIVNEFDVTVHWSDAPLDSVPIRMR